MCGSNSSVVCRSLRFDLLAKRWCTNEIIQKASFELRFMDGEEEIVAADQRTVERFGDDAEAANLGVYFCDQKLPDTANLLLLGFDQRARYFIAQHDALRV